MPDIFLSYSRDDQAVARRFADGFSRAGFEVWWDATLSPGEAYDEVTERALNEARAVVVLWSKKSVTSRWVRAEATQADRNKTLVPVMIEPCTRPIMFELTQTADLSQWNGDTEAPEWLALLTVLRRYVDPVAARETPSAATPRTSPPPTSSPARRSRPVVLAAALAALLLAGGLTWWMTRSAPANATTAVSSAANASLAVLPFADMSAEHDQEYFADGLAEELLNALAQIPDLRVAGRTSSFSFKGKNEDLRVIGAKLGVGNILEGSVRKAGNRLRITAQLIDAANGTHLWSKTFDRELSDIFAVQQEIAMAVSGALSIALDVGTMSRANGGTTNINAYDKFLQAQAAWYRGGDREQYEQCAALYREVLALDPDFSRALYGLNRALTQVQLRGPDDATIAAELETNGARLQALSPDAWWTLTSRMSQFVQQRRWAEAEAAATKALAAARIPETEYAYGIFLAQVGRATEAVDYGRSMVRAEPLSRSMSASFQTWLDLAQRRDEAAAEYQRSLTLEGSSSIADAFALYREWSRTPVDEARLDALIKDLTSRRPGALFVAVPGITGDNWKDRGAAVATLRRLYATQPDLGAVFASMADHYGEKDLVLAGLRRSLVDARAPQLLSLWLWNESGWRNDPRFKDILRDLGLVAYYRSSGKWPDACRPVGAEDFECR